MKELTCGFCEKPFLYHRKKKYCSKICSDRNAKGVAKDSERLKLLAEVSGLRARGQKRCRTCNEVKGLGRFTNNRSNADGKKSTCKSCISKYRAAPENRDKERLQSALRRNGGVLYWTPPPCPDKALTKERLTQARQSQRELLQYAFDNWDSGNQLIGALCWEIFKTQGRGPWSNPGITKAESYSLRYRYDAKFNAKERLRRQISKAKKRDGIGTLIRDTVARGGKSNTVERTLGYSISEFCRHMERQFINGMDWDKFKAGEIHIDHIIPQKVFDLSDDDEWKACWSLTNLQPLWAADNIKKGAVVEKLL